MPADIPELHSYTIRGYIYESDTVTVVSGATVTVTNNTSGGSKTVTSNAWGEFLVELANKSDFPNGYAHLDDIAGSITRGDDVGSFSTTVILE